MAKFTFDFEMDKFFPKGIQDNDKSLAIDMINAGQDVMRESIRKAAKKHALTGSMADSVKSSKPTINRIGDAVGRVKFYGKDENGMKNWYKAIWCEYGTVNQPARPFVRPAIKSCESRVRAAMQKVFDKKSKS